ncbi:MAG: hypothetical protein HY048_03205 [Acidobacteria bacterium]|nr:hypothetical protein [Acidobacteriota bacterium]
MWQPNNRQWWLLAGAAMLAVFLWPPGDDRSLAAKFVNWAVDPRGELPILPTQLALGLGDDPDAVAAHDMVTQQYDTLYAKGGWTRTRLLLKVARDPMNPSTERQLLTAIVVLTALMAWKGKLKTEK